MELTSIETYLSASLKQIFFHSQLTHNGVRKIFEGMILISLLGTLGLITSLLAAFK